MKLVLALVAGYLLGARIGSKDLDQLNRSLKALVETEEFSDVVSVARSQFGNTLRQLADIVDGHARQQDSTGDLVARVRRMVGQD
jgi:predicted nucleotidyltransferase component of viral defense system